MGLLRWSPDTCECSFNLAVDGGGAWRFVTRAEAIAEHQALYAAEPWRVRLMNPATGEKTTHVGIPEGDPQVAALLAAGWVYLHTVEPGFPQRYKNIADPAVSPQPFPTLDIHHSSLGHTKARYDACLHENRRLNRLIEIVSLRLPVTPLQLKSGGLTWAFATNTIAELPGSRVLEISSGTVSLSNADKNAVRAALALEFPTGQIVLS